MENPAPPDPTRLVTRSLFLLGLLVAVGVGAALFVRGVRSTAGGLAGVRLSERDVRERVQATLEREVADAFLVTGRLEVMATTEVSDTKTILPWVAGGLDLGTTTATVRVPGTILYGIPVGHLPEEAIRLDDDGVVNVDVPAPIVKAVEPHLAALEVRTEVGWARLQARSGREAELRAIQLVDQALREQGRVHLAGSREPRIATAQALARVLTPTLVAAGLPRPRFHFHMPGLSVRVDSLNAAP
jgi:hypothetical protein